MPTCQRIIGLFLLPFLLALVLFAVYFVYFTDTESFWSVGRTSLITPNCNNLEMSKLNISETASVDVDTRTFRLLFRGDSKIIINQNMSVNISDDLYYRFVNHRHYICEDYIRLGLSSDGGWDVCLIGPYRFAKPCLVYSFGINNDFSFDDAVSIKYGCTVRAFDPSMKVSNHRRGPNIWFYDTGISGIDNKTSSKNWKLKTLRTLVHELGDSNKTIDYLKMDVESAEWESLDSMLKTNILQCSVKQFGLEVHHSKTNPGFYQHWKVLKSLEEIGFRRWYWHFNHACTYIYEGRIRSGCYEMVYINSAFLNETMRTSCVDK